MGFSAAVGSATTGLAGGRAGGLAASTPPAAFFVGSAVFHYLGPAFAVLLFARVEPLGAAWLRITCAAAIYALWRRPWRCFAALDGGGRRLLLALGAVLAVMNACFYVAIDRLPLATVAAIEFLPVIALAAAGARTARNALALIAAAAGVYLLVDVRIEGNVVGIVLAFVNAALFAVYIVLAYRVAQRGPTGGIDGLAGAMLVAAVVVTPIGGWSAAPALIDPVTLGAAIGVAVTSSVIPYVCDQLAMARMARATYALFVALLPATATVIGIAVLLQLPTWIEVVGVALVVLGVAVHRERRQLPPRELPTAAHPAHSARRAALAARDRARAGAPAARQPLQEPGSGRVEGRQLDDRGRASGMLVGEQRPDHRVTGRAVRTGQDPAQRRLVPETELRGHPRARGVRRIATNLDPRHTVDLDRDACQRSGCLGRKTASDMVGVDPVADLPRGRAAPQVEPRAAEDAALAAIENGVDELLAEIEPAPECAKQLDSGGEIDGLVGRPGHPGAKVVEALDHGLLEQLGILRPPAAEHEASCLDAVGWSRHQVEGPRWRAASKSAMPAATLTFSDST